MDRGSPGQKDSSLSGAAPGLIIVIIVAAIAHLISSLHASFDALVISIIFGMLVSNMFDDREPLRKGLEFSVKIFLPVGIALYGLQLKVSVADAKFMVAAATIAAAMFAVSYFISHGFGLGRTIGFLLGTGMAICGASAIAVVAPIIGARKEDTSICLLSVITIGLTGMLLYRFLPEMMGMQMEEFAFLSGTTLPMMGQVKVAASTMGSESMGIALNYKLVRVSGLAVVAVAALVISGTKDKRFHIPWFMVAFLFFAVAVNVSGAVAAFAAVVSPLSKVFLTAALAAIGLSVDFDAITELGTGPIIAVILAWGITVMTVYLMMNLVF